MAFPNISPPTFEEAVGGEISGKAMLATSYREEQNYVDEEDGDMEESNEEEQLNGDHNQKKSGIPVTGQV